jgi:hypothetical protein
LTSPNPADVEKLAAFTSTWFDVMEKENKFYDEMIGHF